MRLRELVKLVQQLSTGGGGNLDFDAVESPTFDDGGTSGQISPVDDSVTNMVYVTANVADGDAVAIDIGLVTVAFADVTGTQVLAAEVPPGATYSVYRNGVASSVGNILEVPRS